MAFDMFGGLPFRHYGLVLADPNWNFKSNSIAKPGRNARRHYETMSLEEIARLPVERHAADNSLLALWITGPFLAIGAHVPVMRSWGYEPTGMGFVWIKLYPGRNPQFILQRDLFMGGGFLTRKNAEFVVFGKRGRSMRVDAGVREVIISPLRRHSEKPEESYSRLERYVGDVPKLELFGRRQRQNWTVRGKESHKFKAVG